MKGLFDDLPLRKEDVPTQGRCFEGVGDAPRVVGLPRSPLPDFPGGDACEADGVQARMCIECQHCLFKDYASKDSSSLVEHGFAGCAFATAGRTRPHSRAIPCEKFADADMGIAEERREWIRKKREWIKQWKESSKQPASTGR